jgi:dipeptidase
MVIPNYYTITSVDFSKESCMGSDDLIEYAQERGWYSPQDGPFNFRKAYGDPSYLAYIGNIARKWKGVELISGREYAMDEPFPFTLKPEEKLELTDFMTVLENHYEGTKFDDSQNYKNGDPHSSGPNSICAKLNQYGFVAELRSDMPVEIGAVMWLAPRRPCVQPYVPWYLGMKKIPDRFALIDPQTALEQHFDPPENLLEKSEGHAFVEYVNFARHVDDEYKTLIPRVRQFKSAMQDEMMKMAEETENKALKVYETDKDKALQMLMEFTEKYLKQTEVEMNKIIIQSGQAIRK